MLRRELGAFEQGANPQNHLIDIDWLHHVVIRACLKAALLVFEALFGGDNQDRHRKSTRPQVINQFISVHSGHHNIRNNEIYIFRI